MYKYTPKRQRIYIYIYKIHIIISTYSFFFMLKYFFFFRFQMGKKEILDSKVKLNELVAAFFFQPRFSDL